MRTLILVAVMVVLALATGLSFVMVVLALATGLSFVLPVAATAAR